jgi:hypothetical protein
MGAASRGERLVLGTLCCLLGLGGIVALFYAQVPEDGSVLALWPLVIWVLGWLGMGAMLLELPHCLLRARFPDVDFDDLGGGAFLLFAGIALALVPFLDARDAAFSSGRIVVSLAGLVFVLGGVFVAHGAWLGRGRSDTRFARVVVALLLTLFAAAIGVVAGYLALSSPRPALWWIPLPGALLLAFFAVNAWREVVRRW